MSGYLFDQQRWETTESLTAFVDARRMMKAMESIVAECDKRAARHGGSPLEYQIPIEIIRHTERRTTHMPETGSITHELKVNYQDITGWTIEADEADTESG